MSTEIRIFCVVMSVIAIVFLLCVQYAKGSILESLILSNISEDGRLRFCELANKYNLDCIRYNVTTEDGYMLGLFNIPGDKTRPIYLQHGFVDSSDTFLLRTNISWVAYLAQEGFDLWLGNMRGNMHSRAHVSLSPEGMKFWNFSFHEIAKYDVPAMIDFVLDKTGQKQLQVIAHSEGTTLMFTLGVLRPQYHKKLKIVICLSPIAYLHNAEPPLFPLLSLTVGPVLSPISSVLGRGEILGNSSELVALMRRVCTLKNIGYELCTEGYFYPIFGRDRPNLEPKFFATVIGHYPCGSSYKNAIHLFQIVLRREFAQYDYGLLKNLIIYNNAKPPKYNLSKNNMKIALVVALNDRLSDLKDVMLLRRQLPNVVEYYQMEPKNWNHVDYIWARTIKEYLFDYVNGLLNKYF